MIVSGSVTQLNMRISSIAGTAFVDFGAANALTPYVGGLLSITSVTTGKVIKGYVKAAGGASETLGSELHTSANAASDPNGNEANATTGWGTGGTITFTSDGTVFDTGSYSLKGVAGGANGRFTYNFPSGTGKLLKATFKYRHLGSGGAFRIGVASGDAATPERFFIDFTSTLVTFTAATIYFNRQTGTGSLDTDYLYVLENSATNDGGAYIDNFSLKQVTVPGPTGVTITSTPGGSTFNWTSQDSGFDYNDSAGYTYVLSRSDMMLIGVS